MHKLALQTLTESWSPSKHVFWIKEMFLHAQIDCILSFPLIVAKFEGLCSSYTNDAFPSKGPIDTTSLVQFLIPKEILSCFVVVVLSPNPFLLIQLTISCSLPQMTLQLNQLRFAV